MGTACHTKELEPFKTNKGSVFFGVVDFLCDWFVGTISMPHQVVTAKKLYNWKSRLF